MMGKGSYPGANTIIGAKTPSWFGTESTVVSEEYTLAAEQHESARKRFDALMAQAEEKRGDRQHRRKLAEAKQVVQDTAPRPTKAVENVPLDAATELQIAALKRDLAAFASGARSAVRQHEEAREKFVALLKRHGLPIDKYPESEKLKL